MKTQTNRIATVLACGIALIVAGTAPAFAASPLVAAGTHHSVLLKGSGELWTWGDNTFGQLGYDTATDADATNELFATFPQRVGTDADWAQVTAGEDFTLAIKQDGALYGWGHNDAGQLGLGDTTDRPAPTRVGTDTDWAAVAAGIRHTLALKTDGTLWTWGHNSHGELGTGWPVAGTRDFTAHPTPTQVGSDNDWAAVWTHGYHSLALKNDGSLWAWGDNTDGQAGTMPDLSASAPPEGEYVLAPLRVGTRSDWAAVGAGTFHSLAILQDGTLWGFGSNGSGEVGGGATSTAPSPTPTQAGTASAWSDIRAGEGFSVGLTADGILWTWGINNSGQLGYDTSGTPATSPRQVGSSAQWVTVAAGGSFVLAIDGQGSLWAWGDNSVGQLGLGTTTSASVPKDVGLTDVGQDVTAPTVTASPPGGTYPSQQTVTLFGTDDVSSRPTIYFTNDGSDPDPTDATQRYTGPISLNATTTLKFLATDTAGNASAVSTETLTIKESGGSSSGGGCFLWELGR